MNFWLYTLIMFCVLSSCDLTQAALANPFKYLPTGQEARRQFTLLVAPAIVGSVAVPIYGFVNMPWWQPIVGFLCAVFMELHLTKKSLRQSIYINRWAVRLSAATAVLFLVALYDTNR